MIANHNIFSEFWLKITISEKKTFPKNEFDVGQITQALHVHMKKNAKLRKRRPSKIPLHYRGRLEILLNELQRVGIFREMGNEVEMGSLFTNTIIIISMKRDTV